MDPDNETYEFSGAEEDGAMIEVDVLADGTFEEIEEQIDMEAVPQPVSAMLDFAVPGMEPTFIEKSTRDEGSTIIYGFEGQLGGQPVDVEIDEDGSGFVNNADMAGRLPLPESPPGLAIAAPSAAGGAAHRPLARGRSR